MNASDVIHVGIVGVCGGCGRGGQMVPVFNAVEPFHVRALCDIDRAGLDAANETLKADELYYDYAEMLDKSDLDAVFIATPMDLHVPQSIAALARGIHVLCEVTAGVNVDECRDLVAACKKSDAVYMLAENYIYLPHVAAVREMVLKGEFGTPYYAEGGYVSDLKSFAEVTRWRRKWQIGVNGITYICHNLGPMLQWMPGERIEAVSCSGAGHHYRDPTGAPYEAEAISTMLGRTTSGGQVVIRNDFLSNRPGIGVYNDLQGTEGAYESPRRGGEPHRIWLKSRSADPAWEDFSAVQDAFLPDAMKKAAAGGKPWCADHFQARDFAGVIRGRCANPLGIHEAMDQTLPGLYSQLSIAKGGKWMDVPNSREW